MKELSLEEQAVLESLHDPDAPETTTDKFKWDDEFQREIVSMFLHDKDFLTQSRPLVNPNYFTKDALQRITKLIFNYFDKYKSIPSRIQISQLLRDDLINKDQDVILQNLGELNTVIDYYMPGVESRDFFRDKITNFAKTQALKIAFHKCLEFIKNDPEDEKTWSSVRETLNKAMTVEGDFKIGLDYFKDAEARYARRVDVKETGDLFTIGFKDIDDGLKNGGLLRGEIGSWTALSGQGKSLALIHAALCNLNRGKKVLYISLELSEDSIAERLDPRIADPTQLFNIHVNNLIENKKIVLDGIKEYTKMQNYGEEQRLVIKQFAGGTMDVSMLRAFYSQVCLRGFTPDLIIIDYMGEMKDAPGVPTHESRYNICRDLRGFAVEQKICILTAMQPNRSGKEALKQGILIDDENIGDSFAQIRPLDCLWSINQLADEKECSLARGYCIKHREGKSRFMFYIQFNYATLGMSQISQEKYETILKNYRMQKEKTTSDQTRDAIINKNSKIKKGALANFGNDTPDQESSTVQDAMEAASSLKE